MEIREATIYDVKNIALVKQKTWATTYRGIYADSLIDNFDYEREEAKLTNMINSSDTLVYVAIDHENIVGFMSVGKPYHTYLDYEQELGMLYILKSYQGKGLGTKFFKLALEVVKKNGFNRMLVSSNSYNTNAINFYLKMGGKIIHEDKLEGDKRYVQTKFHFDV